MVRERERERRSEGELLPRRKEEDVREEMDAGENRGEVIVV